MIMKYLIRPNHQMNTSTQSSVYSKDVFKTILQLSMFYTHSILYIDKVARFLEQICN